MYTWIRRIHLFTGLGLLLFTVMYFTSGYVLIHRDWFGNKNQKKLQQTETLEPGITTAPEDLSSYLQDRFELRGKRWPPKKKPDGRWQYNFDRPNFYASVLYDPAKRTLEIEQQGLGAREVMVRMHRIRGYEGGWPYMIWAALLDLAAVSMIFFALSGIVMWFTLERRRRWIGWLLLGVSYGYTAAILIVQIAAR